MALLEPLSEHRPINQEQDWDALNWVHVASAYSELSEAELRALSERDWDAPDVVWTPVASSEDYR
jgi:hypothetical protein